jgi:DNA-directed RNA polymerase specialized sigma24 family protein
MTAAIRQVCGRRHLSLVPDVEQEVRLAIWRRLSSGGPIRNARSYLYKVALTTALAMVARAEAPVRARGATLLARSPARAVVWRGRGSADEPPLVDGALFPAERALLFEQALGGLRPDESRAVRDYLSGFNHTEVAALHGWTESVARHRIYRGLRSLRNLDA